MTWECIAQADIYRRMKRRVFLILPKKEKGMMGRIPRTFWWCWVDEEIVLDVPWNVVVERKLTPVQPPEEPK